MRLASIHPVLEDIEFRPGAQPHIHGAMEVSEYEIIHSLLP